MKQKKVLAMLLAATMVFGSALNVSAATGTAEDTTGTTVTGSGTTEYVDAVVYEVGLPTSTSLSLKVDPQGLLGLENNGSATLEELADGAGKIVGGVVPVVNNGSVPVKVSVELKLTGNATAVTAIDDVNSGTAENILLYAVPSAEDTPDADGYVASTKGIVLSTTAATVNFVLPAAKYNVSRDGSGEVTFVKDATAESHGTALKFDGLVNKDADWSAYAGASASKTIGMTAKFTFTHTLAAADVADTADGAPYAMVQYAGDTVTVEATADSGSGSNPSVPSSDGTTDIVISYTGAAPAAGSITFTKPDSTTWTPAAGPYTNNKIKVESSTITLTAGWLAGLKSDANMGTGTYSFTLNGNTYSFTIS